MSMETDFYHLMKVANEMQNSSGEPKIELAQDLIGYGGLGAGLGGLVGVSTGKEQREQARQQAIRDAEYRYQAEIASQKGNLSQAAEEISRLNAPVHYRTMNGIPTDVFDLAGANDEQRQAMLNYLGAQDKIRKLKMEEVFMTPIEGTRAENRVALRRVGLGAFGGLGIGAGIGFGINALRNQKNRLSEEQMASDFQELIEKTATLKKTR